MNQFTPQTIISPEGLLEYLENSDEIDLGFKVNV
jgi:hypothetical protein